MVWKTTGTEATDLVVINDNMLWREEERWFSKEKSILDSLHKVYIYNPNYQKWETMDQEKKWKFKIKVAFTWDEEYIDSFKFWLIDVCKVFSWEVTYKDEYWMTLTDSKWNPAKDYFYSNEFFPISKADNLVLFRSMKWSKDKALCLTKWDLSNILRLPKINWVKNDFSVLKEKQDKSTYRTSSITENIVMYWIFLEWKYEWEYFIFYPKQNLVWTNYSKWEKIKAEEWTLTRILDDSLEWWNKIRTDRWYKPVVSMPYSLVDLKLSTFVKDVMWKDYNVWTLSFEWYTWLSRDNTTNVEEIKLFRQWLFEERFEWFKDKKKVIYIDKNGNEYDTVPRDDKITIVDCLIEHDFSHEEQLLLQSWNNDSDEINEAEIERVFDNPKTQAVHDNAKKWLAPF